ncbi:hypothetical protein Tsp_10525 [Trichinella spiralis]|uniref:hypothetical protein n=1 Tax=Trichinella spiralis TaxID=6334 RepID=UPI0001EFD56F|nr:hypothetical protein Tsp_10525 [Trichinella spiralis]
MGVTLASSLHSEKKSTKRCQSLSQSYNGIGRIFFFSTLRTELASFFADGVTIRCQREPVVADSLNQSKHRLGAERAGAERWNRAATSPIQIVYGQAQLQADRRPGAGRLPKTLVTTAPRAINLKRGTVETS